MLLGFSSDGSGPYARCSAPGARAGFEAGDGKPAAKNDFTPLQGSLIMLGVDLRRRGVATVTRGNEFKALAPST
jgi:hypothetical protein